MASKSTGERPTKPRSSTPETVETFLASLDAGPPRGRGAAVAAVSLALLAAGSVWVLPAWDAALPGGSIAWQVSATALAVVGAIWGRRHLPAGVVRLGARLARLAAMVALVLTLVWLGCIGLLWLIWPR